MVLPGIGGSILAPPRRDGEQPSPVWAGGMQDVGDILRTPENLSIDRELEPLGLIGTRKLFGVWTAISGYDGLMSQLTMPGETVDRGDPSKEQLHATLVAVPYDFRRSIVDAADRLDWQIRRRLAILWPDDPPDVRRVIIVAHSMGGLVARYWLAQEENWQRCQCLITLGTPHGGAPKALDVLANGIQVAPLLRLRRPVPVLREWPGVAELLPRYPTVHDVRHGSVTGTPMYAKDLPIDWLGKPAAAAYAVHESIDAGWDRIARQVPLIPRIGFGHGTLRRCTWNGRKVQVTSGDPALDGFGDWISDLGDGTVPAFSGIPREISGDDSYRMLLETRHGPIAQLGDIERIVQHASGRPAAKLPTRGDERRAVMGIDLEPVAPPHSAIPVSARFSGADADVSEVAVWVSASPTGSAAPTEVRLSWDAAAEIFTGELPPLPPGPHQVRVIARSVPRAGAHEVFETLEVLDGDTLADSVTEDLDDNE